MTQSKLNRRRLINNTLTVGAFTLIGAKLAGQSSDALSTQSVDKYQEPSKKLPVYGRFDVM
jgi:hypothetical protein